MKYFASTSLLSGLQPPETEEHRTGSISLGFEVGWLPELDEGQRRIGFNGQAPQDLNKAPIFARPVVRIGLPDKFTAIVAAPLPFAEVFGRAIALAGIRPGTAAASARSLDCKLARLRSGRIGQGSLYVPEKRSGIPAWFGR